jgi:hypothetical protein
VTTQTEELIRAALKDGCRAHCNSLIDELRRLHALNGELLEALQRSRAQWIHSVNAEFCLAAIARAEGQA